MRVRGSLCWSAGPAGDPPAAPADRQTEFGHGCGARFVGLRGRPGPQTDKESFMAKNSALPRGMSRPFVRIEIIYVLDDPQSIMAM